MRPGDAEYRRKLEYIGRREDRFLVPRDMWEGRDWQAQHEHDAAKRARRRDLIASLDAPLVVPPGPTVASFSLHDRPRDEDRQRRLAANRALEKAGLRPRTRW